MVHFRHLAITLTLSTYLICAVTSYPNCAENSDQQPCLETTTSAEDDDDKNANGVPFGTPDPKLKCALFRVLNPRTETYKEFRDDLDKGGVDTDVTDGSAWPFINVQQGIFKAWKGVGVDTSDLDGYVDGVASHKDLYWPHKDELFDFFNSKVDGDGMISALDIYDGKNFIASTYYDMDIMTFASYLEVSIVFLKCGGDASTGKVSLESVLEFLDAKPPSISGRVTKAGIDEVNAFIEENRKPPTLRGATDDKLGLLTLAQASALVPVMKKVVLNETKEKKSVLRKIIDLKEKEEMSIS